jgi:cellulose synthase/poly-beta-1,6-N-acetylglucosamine synthase-like glycosyltransferase
MIVFAWTVLLVSIATVLYVYIGFPGALFILQLRRRYTAPAFTGADEALRTVSLVVAAYNEEEVIEEKLENGLRIDYPPEKLQFVFVSDSTDGTNEILRRYESGRVRVIVLPERRGKVAALAAALPACTGDILVFSDANTYYRPDSIRMLVRHFQNPQVGLVTGDVRILQSTQAFGEGEGLYYRYERWLQSLETSFWSTVAIDGAMYAIRCSLVRLASHGLVADDLVTGMNVGCQGYRLIYDAEAFAEENPTPTDAQEFKRKIRVIAYAIQSLIEGEGVPPLTQWRLLWVYLSHKVLRWFVPVFLIFALLSAAALALFSRTGVVLFAGQALFYGLAILNWRFPKLDGRMVRIPYYFTMVNAAALLGILRGVRRKQRSVWSRTERIAYKPRADQRP